MVVFLFPFLCVILVAIILFLSIRQYFNSSSHYEDYYIVLAASCSFFKYVIILSTAILNFYDFRLTILVHFLEIFTY